MSSCRADGPGAYRLRARSEFHRQVRRGPDEAQHRQPTIRQGTDKAETRITAQTITAPSRAVQLVVHSVGGIVTPAQQLMR